MHGNTLNRTTMATWKSKPWQTRVQLPSSPYGTGYGVLGLGLKTCLRANLGLFLGAILCSPRVTLGVAPTKPFAATRCCVELALGVTPHFLLGKFAVVPRNHLTLGKPRVGEINWKGNCVKVGPWDWGRSGEANQVENQPNDTNSLINDYFPRPWQPWQSQGTCWNLWKFCKQCCFILQTRV